MPAVDGLSELETARDCDGREQQATIWYWQAVPSTGDQGVSGVKVSE